ncbi:MAG: hypothetical protein AAB363_03480, partial [Planctomycetota bacterium]
MAPPFARYTKKGAAQSICRPGLANRRSGSYSPTERRHIFGSQVSLKEFGDEIHLGAKLVNDDSKRGGVPQWNSA